MIRGLLSGSSYGLIEFLVPPMPLSHGIRLGSKRRCLFHKKLQYPIKINGIRTGVGPYTRCEPHSTESSPTPPISTTPSFLKTPAALCCDLPKGLMHPEPQVSSPSMPFPHKNPVPIYLPFPRQSQISLPHHPSPSNHLPPSHHPSHSQSFPYPSKTNLNLPKPLVDAASAPP
jgi:hypothetical protein